MSEGAQCLGAQCLGCSMSRVLNVRVPDVPVLNVWVLNVREPNIWLFLRRSLCLQLSLAISGSLNWLTKSLLGSQGPTVHSIRVESWDPGPNLRRTDSDIGLSESFFTFTHTQLFINPKTLRVSKSPKFSKRRPTIFVGKGPNPWGGG